MLNSTQRIKKSFSGKGVFPYQFAFTLLLPIRNIFLSPKRLIDRLHLSNNNFVLEVGSGPGYFSPIIAKEIPYGKLVLADIQQEMLDLARKRIKKSKIINVDYYLCNGSEFDLPSNYFDRILLVTVIGEVENKEVYFSEFYRMLKPKGILSISELAGDPDKMSINEIKIIAERFNLNFLELFGSEKNYTINFTK
ncbi:MAG: methyltransferase domain-containing protein [Ignavibacteriae bacterium]|nr:methyltransferase domain-containing protein [Ignavibacteriota bacterium]